MKVYIFATQRGFMRFIFAESQEQADAIWTTELVFTAAEPSKYFCQELPLNRVVEDRRDHMREALAIGVEGIGEFDDARGWRIFPVGEGTRYERDAQQEEQDDP